MGVVNASPRPLLPPGKIRYPLCRMMGGPQSRSGRVREVSPQPALDPRTVQLVASCYTDRAVPAYVVSSYIFGFNFMFNIRVSVHREYDFVITSNKMQLFFTISKTLYMFRAVPPPIIRST